MGHSGIEIMFSPSSRDLYEKSLNKLTLSRGNASGSNISVNYHILRWDSNAEPFDRVLKNSWGTFSESATRDLSYMIRDILKG